MAAASEPVPAGADDFLLLFDRIRGNLVWEYQSGDRHTYTAELDAVFLTRLNISKRSLSEESLAAVPFFVLAGQGWYLERGFPRDEAAGIDPAEVRTRRIGQSDVEVGGRRAGGVMHD